ncbi:sugar-specific transcriptional regulator TrmB [Natrinema hispanicum]|uniref:Sugar-specific transcriptional regulator TrmB n=1 Tax=Natrinema hispanicum TaxID=392421 RepID=A0A482Y699_9EURY|nr:helix-turn-helix domain-containing protein [Natrinema hispanicum]RZV08363.1 sugar-specific transcriptional regulator TrmB [Natrinema hispanicum]
MSSDDADDHPVDDADEREESLAGPDDVVETEIGRSPAVEELDQRIVDLLSWILDTETRAKIYVYLLDNPGSTSEEVAKGTGLYPSTVREALAELHEEARVSREKRASEGAGNNPYEYTAIPPSDLVGDVVDQVQQELNTIFRLDRVLDREREPEPDTLAETEPVTITVDDSTPPLGDDEVEVESVDTESNEDDTDDS